MARITRVKCDGCGSRIEPSEPWKSLRIDGAEDGTLDICRDCFWKMMNAIGRSKLSSSGEGDEDEYGNVTKPRQHAGICDAHRVTTDVPFRQSRVDDGSTPSRDTHGKI